MTYNGRNTGCFWVELAPGWITASLRCLWTLPSPGPPPLPAEPQSAAPGRSVRPKFENAAGGAVTFFSFPPRLVDSEVSSVILGNPHLREELRSRGFPPPSLFLLSPFLLPLPSPVLSCPSRPALLLSLPSLSSPSFLPFFLPSFLLSLPHGPSFLFVS